MLNNKLIFNIKQILRGKLHNLTIVLYFLFLHVIILLCKKKYILFYNSNLIFIISQLTLLIISLKDLMLLLF